MNSGNPLSWIARGLVLRNPPRSDAREQRHASWLELFFDLFFVLALQAVTGRLGDDPAPDQADVLLTLFLYALVQWAWVGQVFYDTRYDPDDAVHRVVVLVAMAGAGVIVLGVDDAPHTLLLPAGYLVVRGTLLLLDLRVRSSSPAAREVTTVYLTGYGLGWLIWLGSLAAPVEVRPAVWLAGLATELATPWLGLRRPARYPVDTSHLPERFGQFTIILLGLSLTDLLDVVSSHPSAAALGAAAVAFVVPAAIWWTYTTFVTNRLALPRLRGSQPYGYLHSPLGASLLFLGWSLAQTVRLVQNGAATIPGSLRALLAGAVVLWVLSGLGLHLVSMRAVSVRRLLITGYGIGSVAVVAASFTDPLTVLVLLAVAVASYSVLVSRHIVGLAAE